jgi:hypothetical protein
MMHYLQNSFFCNRAVQIFASTVSKVTEIKCLEHMDHLQSLKNEILLIKVKTTVNFLIQNIKND